MTRPIQFATNPAFPAGVELWSGQPNKVTPPAGVLADGFTPDQLLDAEYLNRMLSNYGIVIEELRRQALGAACQFQSLAAPPNGATPSGVPQVVSGVSAVAGLDTAAGGWHLVWASGAAAVAPSLNFISAPPRTAAFAPITCALFGADPVTLWTPGTLVGLGVRPRAFLFEAAGVARAIAFPSQGATTGLPVFAATIGAAWANGAGAPLGVYAGAGYDPTSATLILARYVATGAHEIYSSTNFGANWTLRHTFPVAAAAAPPECGGWVQVDPSTGRAFVIEAFGRVRHAVAPYTVWTAIDLPIDATSFAPIDVALFGGLVYVMQTRAVYSLALEGRVKLRTTPIATPGVWTELADNLTGHQFFNPSTSQLCVLGNRETHVTSAGANWDTHTHGFLPADAHGWTYLATQVSAPSASAGGFLWARLRNNFAVASNVPAVQSGQFRPSTVLV